MSVRTTIADELKAVGDALKAEGHALAGEVEKIWTKLTAGLPAAEHQAIENAHAVAADALHAAEPVAAETVHDAATVVGEAGERVESAVDEAAPAETAHTPKQVSAVLAGEAAVTDTAKGA